MTKVVIYHNPRCSKSRGTLAILQKRFSDAEIEEVRYLENPPSTEKLDEICTLLRVEPLEIVRTGEKLFKALDLSKNDLKSRQEWLATLAQNPKLIERPIIVYQNRAVVARPPEKVLDILS